MGEIKETALAYSARKAVPSKKLSFDEFLAWCDEDTWAEWVDGEVVILTPASLTHQRICRFLAFLLGEYVNKRNLGEVLTAPFLVRLPESLRRGREPDILFVKTERLHLFKETYLDGAPDLVIEITSPESIVRDRGEKYVEYEAAGVSEYWLIDPERRQAEFYRLGPDNRFRLFTTDSAGIYRTEVLPGFWLNLNWLWQEPLPSATAVLSEISVSDHPANRG
ncbi:MAG: Uma2 family endonuclease [Bacillota bacterium]